MRRTTRALASLGLAVLAVGAAPGALGQKPENVLDNAAIVMLTEAGLPASAVVARIGIATRTVPIRVTTADAGSPASVSITMAALSRTFSGFCPRAPGAPQMASTASPNDAIAVLIVPFPFLRRKEV